MQRRDRGARFGVAWWDRGGHCSAVVDGQVLTIGMTGDWPRPCSECVDGFAETSFSRTSHIDFESDPDIRIVDMVPVTEPDIDW